MNPKCPIASKRTTFQIPRVKQSHYVSSIRYKLFAKSQNQNGIAIAAGGTRGREWKIDT